MKYRLIKSSDINALAAIHFATREVNSQGIFALMGQSFLRAYYKVVVNDKHSVVVGAEDDQGAIRGFFFCVLDSEAFDLNLRKHKLLLAGAAIRSILTNPGILSKLYSRYKSLKNGDSKFVLHTGVRGGFWGWSPWHKDSVSSLELHERSLSLIRDLGYPEVFIEVDKHNKLVYKFHKLNGAVVLDEFPLPDGRERVIMKYDLMNRKSRIED